MLGHFVARPGSGPDQVESRKKARQKIINSSMYRFKSDNISFLILAA